jgi:hypothetical protein
VLLKPTDTESRRLHKGEWIGDRVLDDLDRVTLTLLGPGSPGNPEGPKRTSRVMVIRDSGLRGIGTIPNHPTKEQTTSYDVTGIQLSLVRR